MDLAALLARAEAALEAPPEPEFPGISRFPETNRESQALEYKEISRISRLSRPGNADQSPIVQKGAPSPACVRPVGGGVARSGTLSEGREKREERENPSGSGASLSRFTFSNREMPGNGAGAPALRVVSQPAAAAPGVLEAQLALANDPALQLAFDEHAAFLEYECNLPRAEAERQAADKVIPRAGVPQPRPSPRLQAWRDGLTGLSPHQRPCPDYRAGEWAEVHSNAVAFLNAFGAQAEAFGWQTHELFGVHRDVGIVRPDYCGALVLTVGGPVRFITADEIRFDRLTYRRKLGQPRGLPVWEFSR